MTFAWLLLVCLLPNILKESRGLQWHAGLEDGVKITHCMGENVTFPWQYTLESSESLVGITWYREKDNGTVVLANLFKETFSPEVDRISKTDEVGIRVTNLSKDDSGLYKVVVRLGGVQDLSTRMAHLLVAEKPKTKQGSLEVKVTEVVSETTDGHASSNKRDRLTCGQFSDLGTPPVSVMWQDPSGGLLPSTSFEDGYFMLDLPEEHVGGNYFCLLNVSSIAVKCLLDSSALREKSAVLVSERSLPVSAAGLNGGAIVGIIIGLLILVAAIVIVVVFVVRSRKGKSYAPKEPDSPGPDQEAAEPFNKVADPQWHPSPPYSA